MSDLKAPTYEDRHAIAVTRNGAVGRAFMVRQPSLRGATFSSVMGASKKSDLKAPTYEDRSSFFAKRHFQEVLVHCAGPEGGYWGDFSSPGRMPLSQ